MSCCKYPGIIILSLLLLITCGCDCDLSSFTEPEERTEQGNMAIYKRQLEEKLLSQYQARPDFGTEVRRVELEATKDILTDETGLHQRVEWAQLVYDKWGERIPELEQEYFVIEFGPEQYRSYGGEPSVKVGVMARGVYSEHQPVRAELVESARMDDGIRYCPGCGASVKNPGICPECLRKARGEEAPEPQENSEVEADKTPVASIATEVDNIDFSDEVERTLSSMANFPDLQVAAIPSEPLSAEYFAEDPFE